MTWASQIQFLRRWFREIATVIADIESHPQFELCHGICFRALDMISTITHQLSALPWLRKVWP